MDNTLSIVPSDGGTNEFPVLKAFQEYIDAEQAKARKRMLGLSVFFIILLVAVVVTFVFVLMLVINRNQALSDKLLDYALKEREKATVQLQPVQVAPQQAPQQQMSIQDMMKPFIERLEREQATMKALYEKQQKESEARYKEAQAQALAREKARDDEMRKAKEALEKERARARQENDRQAEIERHRRRLYPDYYRIPEQSVQANSGNQEQIQLQPPSPSAKPQPLQQTKKQPSASQAVKQQPSLSEIKPVTYFNTDDDDGVPFLLESPKQQQKKIKGVSNGGEGDCFH